MNLLIKSTAIESVLRPFAVGDTTLNRYFASVIDRKPICPWNQLHTTLISGKKYPTDKEGYGRVLSACRKIPDGTVSIPIKRRKRQDY